MMEQNVAVVRRAVEEIWNQGALDLADELFAPDYVNHGGLIPDLVRGPEAIKVSVALYHLAFPDLRITVEELVAQENVVALRWTARGTPRGECPGGATTGTPDPPTGMTFCRIAGDQITESWTCWDRLGLLEQVGLVPSTWAPGMDRPRRLARRS